jgi:beta-lactam-binding protein with PASTA domain
MVFFKNIYLRNLLLLIFIAAALIGGVLLWLNRYTQHGEAVEVPDVKGLSVEKAAPFFTNNSLNYEVVDSIFVKNATPGSIAETTPPIGSKVKKGRTVFLKINACLPSLITIPDLKDFSQRQSLAMLRSLGFEKIEIKIVPGIYQNLVVGLESRGMPLEAGSKVPANTQLSLLVSSGSEEILLLEDTLEAPVEITPEESWF